MSTMRFTRQQKEQILDLLQANGGNVPLTSMQTGVNMRTIYRWRQQTEWQPPVTVTVTPVTPMTPVTPIVPLAPAGTSLAGLSDSDLEALLALKDGLLHTSRALMSAILPAVEDAPLAQIVAALVQLIDRFVRVSLQLQAASAPPPAPSDPAFEIDNMVEMSGDDDQD